MTQPSTFLVTAARGKTGFKVAQDLLEKGHQVRALVHHKDEKAQALAKLGAEIREGDLFNIQSLKEVLQGITRAYFCCPPLDRLVEASANFAVAAREAGLEAVVNLSVIIARAGHPSPMVRQLWLSERVLDMANVGVVHVRPSYFAEMAFMLNGQGIASEGKIYQAHGDKKHAPIATADVARVVVCILLDPEKHIGKTYELTGPKVLSQYEMAEVFSKTLGKEIQYVDTPEEEWRKAMSQAGLPPFLVEHLSRAAEDHRAGKFNKVTNTVYEITGQQPQNYEDFVKQNIAALKV